VPRSPDAAVPPTRPRHLQQGHQARTPWRRLAAFQRVACNLGQRKRDAVDEQREQLGLRIDVELSVDVAADANSIGSKVWMASVTRANVPTSLVVSGRHRGDW